MKQHDKKSMRQLYEQWQSSGSSMKTFSEQQGIRHTTFYYWAKVLKKEGLPSTAVKDKPGFSQIPVPQPENSKALAIIRFPSGARLELHYRAEASFIKALVQ
jgi:hypothetical protein